MLPLGSEYAKEFVLPSDAVFLNHGSFGVDLKRAAALYRETMRGVNPMRSYHEIAPMEVLSSLGSVADLFGLYKEDISFVQNATEGVTTAFRTLLQNPDRKFLEPGDEILVTSHEYGACINQLESLIPEGVKLVTAEVPFPVVDQQDVVDAVMNQVTGRTRILFISHITSPTGLIFPIEKIVPKLEADGIACVVDGAHGPGMIPELCPSSYGASFYVGNLHKWLCAPPGSAFLYIKEDLQDVVVPPVRGWGEKSVLREGETRFHARMMSRGVIDYRAWIDTPSTINALREIGFWGLDGIARHNQEMLRKGRDIVCDALGVDYQIAPDSMIGTLAAIPLPLEERLPGEAMEILTKLDRALLNHYKIEVPIIPNFPKDSGSIRISFHLYNSLEQYEYLGWALRDFFGISSK